MSTLKQLREGCVVQFMSNYTFCEYFKDVNEKYTKGNNDVSSLFLIATFGYANWVKVSWAIKHNHYNHYNHYNHNNHYNHCNR